MKRSGVLAFFLPFIIILPLFFCYRIATRIQDDRLADSTFTEFIDWMRRHNYSPDIIDIYKCNYNDPALKAVLRDYMRISRGKLRVPPESQKGYEHFRNDKEFVLTLIEVIPTGENVQFAAISPEVIPEFNKYLNERFGRRVKIDHQKVSLNYGQTFGDIFFSYADMLEPSVNPKLAEFMDRFEPPCLIRFDAEIINGRKVADIWNIRHCAIIAGRNYRLVDNVQVFDKYAHEFGHNIGLDHQFVDPDNPPRYVSKKSFLEDNKNKYAGVDDIMIKSKDAENPAAGHYVSPLSRFVLEPRMGYDDEKEMGSTYNGLYSTQVLKNIKRCACK